MATLIGAIDIGGTKVGVGVADASGRLLASGRFATLPQRGAEAVVAEAVAALQDLVRAQDGGLGSVGVGCAGPLDADSGVILSPPNLPGWDRVPLKGMLEQALGVAVRVDNDANAAALAEYRLGAGQGAKVLVYVTVSTGVGGGIVLDGRLLHGVGNGAGEFGHQTIQPNGPECGCGNRGCLEALASGTAILKRAHEAIAAGRGAGLLAVAAGNELHAGHVAEAAAQGNKAAQEIWGGAMEALALGLGNVITTLAPDRLVIGGGVSLAGEALLAPLRDGLARHVKLVPLEQVELRLAACASDSGLYGAIALGMA